MSRHRVLPPGLSPFHPAALIATWGGSGLLPRAPGTWGSLAALPFAWVLLDRAGWVGLAVATVVVAAAGLWAAAVYVRHDTDKDPGAVVVDEVAGQWLTLLPAVAEPSCFVLGFVLFRAFDILKPWPVSWADRRLPGAWGIMVDDLLAGVYAGAILFAVSQWIGPHWFGEGIAC